MVRFFYDRCIIISDESVEIISIHDTSCVLLFHGETVYQYYDDEKLNRLDASSHQCVNDRNFISREQSERKRINLI